MKPEKQEEQKADSAKKTKGQLHHFKLFSLVFLVRLLVYFLIIISFLYLSLPYLAQRIIPKIAAAHGFAGLSLKVDRFGLKQTAASSIEVKDAAGEGLQLAKLVIEYSPKKIIRGEFGKITLIGLNTSIDITGDTVVVAGLPEIFSKNNPENNSDSPLPEIPIKIKKFEISRSTCMIISGAGLFHLPYDLTIEPSSKTEQLYDVTLSFYFQGHKVVLLSKVDLPRNHFELEFTTQKFPLYHPNGILPINPDLVISAFVDILAKVSGTIKPFLPNFDANIYLDNFTCRNSTVALSSKSATAEPSEPIKISISGSPDNFKAGLSHLYVADPPILLSDLKLLAITDNNGLGGSGNFNVLFDQKIDTTVLGLSGVTAKNNFDFQLQKDDWQFNSEISITPVTANQKEISLSFNQSKFNLPPINSFVIKASGDKQEGQAKYQTRFKAVNISSPPTSTSSYKAELKDFSLDGALKLTGLSSTIQIAHTFELAVSNVILKTPLLQVNSSASIKGQSLFNSSDRRNPLYISGFLKLANGRLATSSPQNYRADFSATIPIAYPSPREPKNQGAFMVEKIKKDDIDLGKISGKINFSDNNYKVLSNYQNQTFPDLEAKIVADIDINDSLNPTIDLDFSLPEFKFDSKTLQKIYDLGNFTIAGKISGGGKIKASAFGLRGSSHFKVSDTDIINEFDNLAINGLNLAIEFPDINQIKSSSSKLVFAQAKFGDITFDGGKAAFQIEGPESLLIEKSSFKWSKGNIDLMATRIRKTTEPQDFLLYCNGLNLAEMLVQLGVSNVSGKGTVNGKIPAILENGKIMFDDGFLYSTPGTGGNININNSEILLAGIPKNTIQYGQLDFAGEALKNFYYNWVTLDLKSNGEDAILAMKLDGKPAKPLPFKYDTDVGTFVRMESYGKGVNYPIVLDVNFHLPLNKMINYGNSLRDLFN